MPATRQRDHHTPAARVLQRPDEARPLNFQGPAHLFQLPQVARGLQRRALAPYHHQRHDQERRQGERDPVPSPETERRLRARGFAAASASPAGTAFDVRSVPSGRPRQVHTGWSLGHTQALAHSRNWCFTIRSSPE